MAIALVDADLRGLGAEEVRVVNDITSQRSALLKTVDDNGGVSRDDLLEVLMRLKSLTAPSGGGAFAARLIAFTAVGGTLSVSVHAGRAYTNNEALLAVLAAAATPRVRTHVAVVPDKYKGSAAGVAVRRQLLELAKAPGVDLDLDRVALVTF